MKQPELPNIIHLGDWSFHVINLEDKDLYESFVKKTEYPANLWTANFAFLWAVSQSDGIKILWRIVDDMLVTFSYLKSGTLYLTCLPFGKGSPEKVTEVVYKCLKYCNLWNRDSDAVVKVINSSQLNFLKQANEFNRFFRPVPLVGLEKHFSIRKLLSLPGKEFETVRRKINKFRRLCPNAVVRPYDPGDYEAVMKLGDYWSRTSGKKYSHIFDDVYFREIIRHCRELGHIVLVIENEGVIIGMVSGGELPTGQSWWCLSKFENDYDGLSETLVVELAKAINKLNPRIELMNAANDLGPGGLRFFKEKFRPVLDLRLYVLPLR